MAMSLDTLIKRANEAFDAALAAAAPGSAMAPALDRLDHRPTHILAIGKAASAMARACRDHGLDAQGVIITNPENAADVEGFELIIGGHPVPDQGSMDGAKRAIELTSSLGPDDHLLVLLSGGGSALMTRPVGDLDLDHKRIINEALLARGMDIHRMNACRRLFSAVKGGRLAGLAAPARVTQWVLSDVPGDHLASIASGPFAPDPWSFDDAVGCVVEAGITRHDWATSVLDAMRKGDLPAPLRDGDPAFDRVETSILASNAICREAASNDLGDNTVSLPDLDGDAMAMGRTLAHAVMNAPAPLLAVTGGETVVTLPQQHGLGGRSQALALSFLLAMEDAEFDWVLLAAGTDGRDGPTDAAGGLVTSGMRPDIDAARAALDGHDSYHYLDRIGGLLRCPPTGTNLADIAIVLTSPKG
ncbi:MAG: hydroxypyruvate reductase [SAR116 cluster bacterium MED-G04]|nr:hydroxypyruvate reductase [SAR116 cluster bacterium]PDH65749.1 MAG: hydroxypyruvate reductase [SAR116 cluster bacterium MED-G04]|tara:strand:+ start:4589 stop:5839 length:1251 start_codon:yes stop_codon:yes gene_type:complete